MNDLPEVPYIHFRVEDPFRQAFIAKYQDAFPSVTSSPFLDAATPTAVMRLPCWLYRLLWLLRPAQFPLWRGYIRWQWRRLLVARGLTKRRWYDLQPISSETIAASKRTVAAGGAHHRGFPGEARRRSWERPKRYVVK